MGVLGWPILDKDIQRQLGNQNQYWHNRIYTTQSVAETENYMFKGAVLFALSFVLIAPQTRTFLMGVLANSIEDLNKWAPFSYLAVLLLVAALVVSIVVVRSWPERVDPENPMAKYNREAKFEE